MELSFECQKRKDGLKANAVRRDGMVPAVLYGHDGGTSVSLAIEAKAAETLLKKASVNNTLIDLSIPEISWTGKTLLREVQTHPWKGTLRHISFFSIAAQKTVEVVVPLQCTGTAIGVRQGGALDVLMNQLTVQCPPDSIPEMIEIDISDFKIGKAFHVGELALPENVSAVGELERIIVAIAAPKGGVVAEADAE